MRRTRGRSTPRIRRNAGRLGVGLVGCGSRKRAAECAEFQVVLAMTSVGAFLKFLRQTSSPPHPAFMPRFALVMVDDSGGNAFDYELPEAVAGQLQVGSRVRVPVRTRTALGTILEVRDTTEARGVKPISEVVSAEPILSPLLIRLGALMADYYCCPLEAAMRSVLPNVIRKAEVGHKRQLFARLAREVRTEQME